MWNIYEIHIVLRLQMKVKNDHRSKFSNLSNWNEEAWRISGLQRDSNPRPPRHRCETRATELWSHTLWAWSICWVHICPCSEMMWNIYIQDEFHIYISHHFTARADMTSLPMCGFTAQLVECRTGIAEVTVRIPLKPWYYNSSNCLNWKIYCYDHSSLWSTTADQYEFRLYFTSFHCSGRYEINQLTSHPMCGFTAQLVEFCTGVAEVTGSNSVEALIFFRLLPANCLNWKIYCSDHSSLSNFIIWFQ